MPRLLCLAALIAVAGCEGSLGVSQRLAGEWTGRPETAAERLLREWPGDKPDPADPKVAAALAETPRTDLEEAGPLEVGLTFEIDGSARMTLAGEPTVTADWGVRSLEGRRAGLTLMIPGPGDETTVRRFDLEFTRDNERFTLRESGADRQLGRLLFTRIGASEPAPSPEATP